MLKPCAIALLLLFECVTMPAQTGMRLSGTPAPASMHRPGGFPVSTTRHRSLIGLSGAPFHDPARRRGYGRNSFPYSGMPYVPAEYEDSYEQEIWSPAVAPPAVTVMQSKQEPVPSAALLELQGNRWVKVESFAVGIPSPTPQTGATTQAAVKELPPTVIVYRDGHREELSSYSIIGATLYAKSDYLATGTWTRKILLADLDLPNTLKQNQQRGVKFDLPTGPNEVVLRP